MVEEAGGSLRRYRRFPLILERPEFVAAATQPLLDELIGIVAR